MSMDDQNEPQISLIEGISAAATSQRDGIRAIESRLRAIRGSVVQVSQGIRRICQEIEDDGEARQLRGLADELASIVSLLDSTIGGEP